MRRDICEIYTVPAAIVLENLHFLSKNAQDDLEHVLKVWAQELLHILDSRATEVCQQRASVR